MAHEFNAKYTGENLSKVAFPMGGIGAGMVCLEGNGALSHVSVRHRPEVFNEPLVFSALNLKWKGNRTARILQGRTPGWKIMFPWGKNLHGAGSGGRERTFGFPFFRDCSFEARFPFATVELSDQNLPVSVKLTGWSPFIPGDSDNSSLPVAGLEYTIRNDSDDEVELVFYHAAKNFMESRPTAPCCGAPETTEQCDPEVFPTTTGYVLYQPGTPDAPHHEGAFAVACDEDVKVNCRWFRGGWFDSPSVLWKEIENGETPERAAVDDDAGPSTGGSLAMPFKLAAGESRTIRLLLAWYVPHSDLQIALPAERADERYQPWYAGKFSSVEEVLEFWRGEYSILRKLSEAFVDWLYNHHDMPSEAIEAVAANLTILKSPTVLRQFDGRIWAWEGCCDDEGCCHGSCTHVWNYAQALPHLFPDLERSLRQTEFYDSQDERGHQDFRTTLPIGPGEHKGLAASDGQLGGIMKVHRDWRISGDNNWLRSLWPKVKQSLEYCIEAWDPDRNGYLAEPHHNTYDIEFWGADGMCTSFYLGALKAAAKMAEALGEDGAGYESLYQTGRAFMEAELFNGEYFFQRTQWEGLRAASPMEFNGFFGESAYASPEAQELLKKEGPKYQYGEGCLADGVLGQWMAEVCGIGEILDPVKVKSHLLSVYKYNFRRSLHDHANPQRPTYALNEEAGLLLCTWPHGEELTLPFPYSNEVWTGFEYQVASHLIMLGELEKGLDIVRAARSRYDGTVRNPFDEYECGHWYARAMSSFALVQAFERTNLHP